MTGRLKRPSHKCPRIQACARPRRQIGTFLRPASSPANTMNAEPTIPNVSPMALPPAGPDGARTA